MKSGTWKLRFSHDTSEQLEGTVTAIWTETAPDPKPEGWSPLVFNYQDRTKIDGPVAKQFITAAQTKLASFLEQAAVQGSYIQSMETQLNNQPDN